MAIADASYMFTYVDVGDYRRQNDSSAFNDLRFGTALKNGQLNIPHSDQLPGTSTRAKNCSYRRRGFPIEGKYSTPLPWQMLPEGQRIYNIAFPEREGLLRTLLAFFPPGEIFEIPITSPS